MLVGHEQEERNPSSLSSLGFTVCYNAGGDRSPHPPPRRKSVCERKAGKKAKKAKKGDSHRSETRCVRAGKRETCAVGTLELGTDWGSKS